MVATGSASSSEIRSRLGHPVVDADGHFQEVLPVFEDYLKQVGGSSFLDVFRSERGGLGFGDRGFYQMAPETRREGWLAPGPWWALPSDARDVATSMAPRLLHQRLEEMGLDYTILYPSVALPPILSATDEIRRVTCRALNMYIADTFGEFGDRMTGAAAVPLYTPDEGIEELEFAVRELGLKAVMIPGFVPRRIPGIHDQNPELFPQIHRPDHFAIDSEHDYDPFWAKCVELGVVPACHSGSMGMGFRRSVTNYMNNHIGHFAAIMDAFCKALFFGGVTRRFPSLNFAFLECGVGWASTLYSDIIARWEKRNPRALKEHLDPANLDQDLLLSLIAEYGNEAVQRKMEELAKRPVAGGGLSEPFQNDFGLAQVEEAEQIHDLFVTRFYFGCEADDPTMAAALSRKANALGARLRPLLSSDIGHWDVPDMREVLAEAYELVERGVLSPDDFRDVLFTNPVVLYGSANPNFFSETAFASEAASVLEGTLSSAAGG